jgi:hypothetical protein
MDSHLLRPISDQFIKFRSARANQVQESGMMPNKSSLNKPGKIDPAVLNMTGGTLATRQIEVCRYPYRHNENY